MKQQTRVIFDSNVYGTIFEQGYSDKFVELVEKRRGELIIYGNDLIRKELRATPKAKLFKGKKVRMRLINLFDLLVGKHIIPMGEVAENIATYYLLEYKGNISKEKLRNDFLIVACATIKGLDIVVSEDNKTMLSRNALNAYEKVNKRNGLPTPKFYSLKEFEQKILEITS